MLKISEFFIFLAKIPEFCKNANRTLIGIVRLVRSLADRTFQPRSRRQEEPGPRDEPVLLGPVDPEGGGGDQIGPTSRDGTMADRQHFSKMYLDFGCVGTDLCKKIRALQHFSKSNYQII